MSNDTTYLFDIRAEAALAVYELMYDEGSIDGFPDSCIECLGLFFDTKALSKEVLFDLCKHLQRSVTDSIDEDFTMEAVNYHLS